MIFADIDLKQLKELKSEKELWSYARPISINCSIELDVFLKERMKYFGYRGMLPNYINPILRTLEKGNYRYMIVDVNGNMTVIILKRILMFKVQFIRMIGLPISLDNMKSAIILFQELVNNKLIKQVYLMDCDIDFLKWNKDKLEFVDSNHYSVIGDKLSKIDKSSWRGKYGINKSIKNPDISFRKIELKDHNAIKEFDEQWVRFKEDQKEELYDKKLLMEILDNLAYGIGDGIFAYGLFYKDIPMGVVVYLRAVEDYAIQVVEKSVARTYYNDYLPAEILEEDNFKQLLRNVSTQMYYFSLKELEKEGIKAIYCGGAVVVKSLREHKSSLNDFTIDIYKLSIGGAK